MTTVDILIIVTVGLFMALGFRDGLLKKIFAIMGFFTGLICATKFMIPAGEFLARWASLSKENSNVFAFFLIFVLIIIIENLFYHWFGTSGSENLSIRSRLAGTFVGAAQGTVVVSLILLMFSVFEIPSEESRSASNLYAP